MKKTLLVSLSVLLVAALSIGMTVAYLTDTDSDVNVMTMGNVSIKQTEYERIPDETSETGWKAADASYAATFGSDTYYPDALRPFTQGKPAYPAVYQDGNEKWDDRKGSQDASGATSHQQSWKEVGAPGSNQLLDNSVKNVIDKFVFVENDGKTDAYYRTLVAVESPADNTAKIHMVFNINSRFDAVSGSGAEKSYFVDHIEIDGVRYALYNVTYNRILTPGEVSRPSLLQVYLDPSATNEDCATFGETWEILVLSQAVQAAGWDDAATALNTAFGTVKENAAEWFGGVLAEDSGYVDIPADAVAVADLEEFTAALTAGGNYKIVAPFTVEGVLNVSADTALYNNDPANVLTFAQNARIKTAENADLALYGIEIDGGGSFDLADDSFSYDKSASNSDAMLMAFAGSTLTLGQKTNIQNVVSQYPAVAWAKGTVDNRATIILEGVTIQNCAGGSGSIVNVDRYGDVYIEDGTLISDNVSHSGNHGIIRVYNDNWDAVNASTLNMNGGEIRDNYFSGNGMIGLYYAKMNMNGGKISGNAWLPATASGRGFYCVVYVHSNSQFLMNGGEISGNTITDGAINCINSSVVGAITFNEGTVTNNSNTRNDGKDALAAVCYPNAMEKSLVISEKANVTGTVYNHAIEGDVVVRNYSEIAEFFAE